MGSPFVVSQWSFPTALKSTISINLLVHLRFFCRLERMCSQEVRWDSGGSPSRALSRGSGWTVLLESGHGCGHKGRADGIRLTFANPFWGGTDVPMSLMSLNWGKHVAPCISATRGFHSCGTWAKCVSRVRLVVTNRMLCHCLTLKVDSIRPVMILMIIIIFIVGFV